MYYSTDLKPEPSQLVENQYIKITDLKFEANRIKKVNRLKFEPIKE